MHTFGTASSPKNYFARREQRKLMLVVFLIGLPLVVWDVVRRAQNNRAPGPEGVAAIVDPRLPERRKPADVEGAFVSPRVIENAAEDKTGAYFPGVKPDYLQIVEDDTPSRSADRDACYNLLEVLRRTPDEQIAAASQGPVSYVSLYRQPTAYRGKLVDLRGTVRRVHQLALPKNEVGIDHYHEVWLFPEGGPPNPIKIYALELPPDFPTGMDVREPVTLTGFFFKRVAYSAQGGGMTAPMLLAKTVRWNKDVAAKDRAVAEEQNRGLGYFIMAAMGVSLVLLLGSVFVNRLAMRTMITPRPEMTPSTVETIASAPQSSVEESLARLAEDDTPDKFAT